jgi:hypothetical protein
MGMREGLYQWKENSGQKTQKRNGPAIVFDRELVLADTVISE